MVELPPIDTPRTLTLSDTVEIFNHVDANGPMWSEDGPRTVDLVIKFSMPYAYAPIVTAGLSGIDSSQDRNLRFNLTVKDITKSEFTISFHTWDDTKIARACANWMSSGIPLG